MVTLNASQHGRIQNMRKFLSLAFPLLESYRRPAVSKRVATSRTGLRGLKMGCSNSTLQITNPDTPKSTDDEYVEGVVCQDADVGENEMKVFDLSDAGKVLLVRQQGKLTALGTKCTHYGAPLDKGALGEGRIRCPWHGACFNITTGDIEDFPGLDSLPCFQVTVENEQVKVRARKTDLTTSKRVKTMASFDCREAQNIVVIGGGPAGAACVETLRQEGFSGDITMVAKENYLPYDRVKVSKAMDVEISKLEMRTPDFYKEHGITIMRNTEATAVDTKVNKVTLSNGNVLSYDRLFVATGSKPLKADVPGADLENVLVLRNYDDAAYLSSQLDPLKDVVVLGSSFIALEVASYCVTKARSVTVIARGNSLLKQSFGPEIGAAIRKMFEEKGVMFIMRSGIARCVDKGNKMLGGVELNDGSPLKADLCIMGVGSSLYTGFLSNSGLALNSDGSIDVNEFMQTSVSNVYAGGDIAKAPVWSHGDVKTTIGHFPLAHMHGHIAGLNMLNKNVPLKAVPYFWTMLFGKSFRYAGHGFYSDIVYAGKVAELKFVAYYLNEADEVIAASSCMMDPVVSQFAELMAQGKKLQRKDIDGDTFGWIKNIN